jgi:uncharacterized membrane protein YhaH (DUF805 family)
MTDELFLFEGRMSRKKYGTYTVGFLIAFLILNYTLNFGANLLAEAGNDFPAILLFSGGFALRIFISLLSMIVTCKRFHDINTNGIFSVLSLIPYVQIAIVLVLLCIKGTKGSNRYGEVSIRDCGPDEEESFSMI